MIENDAIKWLFLMLICHWFLYFVYVRTKRQLNKNKIRLSFLLSIDLAQMGSLFKTPCLMKV